MDRRTVSILFAIVASVLLFGGTRLLGLGGDQIRPANLLADSDGSSFVAGTRKTCIRTVTAIASRTQGVPPQKLEAACNCVADGMTEILAQDEARKFMAEHPGEYPPILREKLQPLTIQCSNSVFGNPG